MGPTRDSVSDALEAITTRFATMVRQVGRRYRLHEADLDEVMQEVRIRLWRAHGESEQISAVTTSYVYRTAMSAALDMLRRRSARRASDTVTIDDHVEIPAAVAGPDGRLAESELAGEIADALRTIPESRRPVVRLYLTGYPREEIADMLGWTEAKTRKECGHCQVMIRGPAECIEDIAAARIPPHFTGPSKTWIPAHFLRRGGGAEARSAPQKRGN